jgi:putative tryptophan/tyrosine transport system substrate-binding protein
MGRRSFLGALAGSLLAAPVAAEAQTAGRTARIGILSPTVVPMGNVDAFEHSLQELGWIKGKNLNVEFRTAAGAEAEVLKIVSELAGLNPDVLVVWGTLGALAVKQVTSRIPVVFLATGDPVGLGLVSSLARPSGNLTGVAAIASSDEFAKRLELLKEAVPSVTRVTLLVGPDGRALMNLSRPTMMAAASAVKLDLQEVQVETREELPAVVRKAKGQGTQALYVWPSGFMLGVGQQLAKLAVENRLPSIHPFSESAKAGGLLSYSASLVEIARRGARYVDRILRGAKPGDLPIEEPTTFELVINLKTAKALGLTIPPSLLQRADQLIE